MTGLANLRKLGSTIRGIRDMRGLSQNAVAKLSGISRKRLSEIEQGGNPSVETLAALATALGIKSVRLDTIEFNFGSSSEPPIPSFECPTAECVACSAARACAAEIHRILDVGIEGPKL